MWITPKTRCHQNCYHRRHGGGCLHTPAWTSGWGPIPPQAAPSHLSNTAVDQLQHYPKEMSTSQSMACTKVHKEKIINVTSAVLAEDEKSFSPKKKE